MTSPVLSCYLLVGAGLWLAAGRAAVGRFSLKTAVFWAVPLLAGATAVTVLSQLDRSVPAFRSVAARAALFWILAAALFTIASVLDAKLLMAARWWLAALALGVQAAALATGSTAAGQISLQVPLAGAVVVSELTRVLLVVATAAVVARLEPVLDQPLGRGAMRPLVIVGACWLMSALMSFSARDTGAAALTLVVMAVAALFVLGRPLPTLAILVAGATGVGLAAVAFPHAVSRITSFLTPPTGDRIDQARMALYASSSGRWLGNSEGGRDLQYVGSTLDDDFLLAAVGRVLGLSGVVAVVLLVAAAAVACLRPLESLRPTGVRAWVSVIAAALWSAQLLLSAGGVFGVLPATGVPVPFMTGSGASLAAAAVLLGVVAATHRSASTRREGASS